jgi:GNAT superfamily N-acetyltransferase
LTGRYVVPEIRPPHLARRRFENRSWPVRIDFAKSAYFDGVMTIRPVIPRDIVIRTHRPGDIGWIISLHGELYSRDYGWDITFEALVAEIAAAFLRNYDPARERCLIAELDGTRVGSALVVHQSDTEAKLRLVIMEPRAQGLGLGKRLVAEAMTFAKAAGYTTMSLWTNDVLHAARHIYMSAGFRLIAEEKHHSFGVDLVGQHWECDLA